MTCNICCEKYNKSVNAKITCPISTCNYEACKTCVRTYLLNTTNDPHCMNCKNQWSSKFLVENLNRSYIDNDYKKHRKQLLVDREISRTPELMNLVEKKRTIDEKNEELSVLNEEFMKVRKMYDEMSKALNNKKVEIQRIKNGEVSKDERKKFIMPCSADNCKGYLSTQYKCEVCKLFTCPDCFEIIGYSKEDQHICKDDNIKSAELIKKETKGCPKCGVRIFKISGCDQMWCTECKVAFSWNTGKVVVSQNIHNPHYYNYLRENGLTPGSAPRNPGDQVCGGLIPYYSFNTFCRFLSRFVSNEWFAILKRDSIINKFIKDNNVDSITGIIGFISNLHRFVNHISNVDLINCRHKVRNLVNFDELTVEYIMNKKTKNELATSIFRHDNLRRKHSEILNVFELLNVVGVERLNSVYDNYVNKQNSILKNKDNELINCFKMIVELIDEYNNLISYCNKQLVTISYTYNQTVGLYGDHLHNYKTKSAKYKQADLVKYEKREKQKELDSANNYEASCSYL
jgi:hypothetical protein